MEIRKTDGARALLTYLTIVMRHDDDGDAGDGAYGRARIFQNVAATTCHVDSKALSQLAEMCTGVRCAQ